MEFEREYLRENRRLACMGSGEGIGGGGGGRRLERIDWVLVVVVDDMGTSCSMDDDVFDARCVRGGRRGGIVGFRWDMPVLGVMA